MGFQKKPLSPKPRPFSGIDIRYSLARRQGLRTGFFMGVIALSFLFFFALSTITRISGFDLSLQAMRALMPLTLVTSADTEIETPDIINILVTGRGGGWHDAPDLTDTIMLASLSFQTKTVSLLSIPRDLYVEYPTGGRGRINEVYMRAIDAGQTTDQAMYTLGEKITEITGEPVHRYVAADFAGFIKVVDILGGVTVDIPEDFVDTAYPDGNWGYTTFRLDDGVQILDGETALKYVRSRHSTSDFDRSLRQQTVLRALRDRAFEMENLTSPSTIKSLYYAVEEHIETDIPVADLLFFANFARTIDSEHILSFNLNDTCFQGYAYCQTGGFLYAPNRDWFGGMSILLPDGATAQDIAEYSRIRRYANLIVHYPDMFLEKTPLVFINTTRNSGIAARYALMLRRYGFSMSERDALFSNRDGVEETFVHYVPNENTAN